MLLCIRSAYLRSGLRYSGFLNNLPTNIQLYFCAVYDYVEKGDLSKGYQNPPPQKKLGVTKHFTEITEF